jgi:hypothetical protein
MSDIPNWNEALEDFRTFLSSQGYPSKLYWIFREDIFRRSHSSILVRWPLPMENTSLTERVFEGGRTAGLVSMCAVGRLRDNIIATVWYPKFPNEEVQGWNRGLKFQIYMPLGTATKIPHFIWFFLRRTEGYKMYERNTSGIGTRSWAVA